MKKKLTIFLVTNNYRPYSAGVVQSIETLQSNLQKSGHEVFIIAPDFTGISDNDPFIIRLYCPIKFKYFSNHIAIPWRSTRQLERLLEKYKPDIVHSQHPFLLGRSALKIARKKKLPIVFTYHSLYEAYSHYFPAPQGLTKKIIAWLVKNYCASVDGIIVPTKTIQSMLAQKVTTPTAIIPTAIRQNFFCNEVRKTIKKPVRLLSVSRFVSEKNIPFLLRVMTQLPKEFSLNLIGFGGLTDELKKIAFTDLKLSEAQVIFVINPPFETLVEYYHNSDIFIFASRYETQALVLAEAMASSLPVIAVDAPGACDIIINAHNGFLVNSEAEMAEKNKQLADNKQLYEYLSNNARLTAQKYMPDQFGNAVLTFYKKMITAADYK